MLKRICLAACLWAAAPGWVLAQDAPLTPEQRKALDQARAILQSEHPERGDVRLASAKVTLRLGEGFYFLGPADARRVLVEGWGNPPGSADGVLGLVFPAGKTFLDSWGAVATYDATGYVSDRDAQSADYDNLLRQSRQGEDQDNAQRKKDGFPASHLVGWAQAPTYDPASHSEIWARDLRFGGEKVDTLNYDTRILGRQGVLSLNLVSTMDQLPEARAAAAALARTVRFDAGARYEDYQDGVDTKAAYGVAGLVAAGLGVAAAQKFGLLAVILLFAKKGFVLIAAAGAWIAARFRKLPGLGRKPKAAPASPAEDAAP